MTKKSTARRARDEQSKNTPNHPGKWEDVIGINHSIAHMLMSSKAVIQHHQSDPELVQHSPNKQVYVDALNSVATNFTTFSTDLIALKDKIGDRKGPVIDPNEAMDLLSIHVSHSELLTKLDTVYRPSLVILQEQMNLARNARAQTQDSEQVPQAVPEQPVAEQVPVQEDPSV